MKLLVGLGNPGTKYAGNRHNIGFMALDAIASRHHMPAWRKRFQGLATDGEIDGERVLLLKPQTYVNESGRAVSEAARFLKLSTSDILVFHDELDLEPARLRVKTGGGNAGHNGLRSITACLDNEYARVRLGIGHPGHKDLVSNYVLNDFAKADQTWLTPLMAAIAEAAGWLGKGDHARFQTAVALARGETAPAAPEKAAAKKPPRVRPDGDQEDGDRRTKGAQKPPAADPGSTDEAVANAASDGNPPAASAPSRHPAGERQSKRQNALAENLRKWLARKGQQS